MCSPHQVLHVSSLMSDLDGCRDYTDVVKRPMDLDTVRKWIEGGSYDRPISDIPSYEEVSSPSFPH